MWYKYCNDDYIQEALNIIKNKKSIEEREREFNQYEIDHWNEWDALQKIVFTLNRDKFHKERVIEEYPWEDVLPWFKRKFWRKQYETWLQNKNL
jgi:hypothetical protein